MKPSLALSLLATALAISVCPAAPDGPKPGDYRAAKKDAIPGNVWGVFSFADAQKEAVKKKRPITLLITDEREDDPAVKKAGVKAFWALEEESTVVVLRLSTANDWVRLPELAQKAAKSASLGTGYPKLFAVTDDVGTLLAGMPSSKIIDLSDKDLTKFGRELKKLDASKTASTDFPPPSLVEVKPALPAAAAAKPAAPGAPPAAAPAPAVTGPVAIKDAKVEGWTNTEGRAIQAALVEVDGDTITFLINGRKIPYALNKLSPESQKRVEELKTASAK